MLDSVEMPRLLRTALNALWRTPKDREVFLYCSRPTTQGEREWLYDLRELLSVVETPRKAREAEEHDRTYYDLFTRLRARKPIGKGVAELLVRCHPMMPFPLIQKEGRCEYVEYPPSVIQAYLNRSGFETLRKGLALCALCSVEWFEKTTVVAETSPWHFDALHDAAILATYPNRQLALRLFTTTDHLRIWKYHVDKGLITRPTRHKPGRDKLQNMGRNMFFYLAVEDLRSCGLWKTVNAEAGTTAFSVVAEVVYGENGSSNTVKSGYKVAKDMLVTGELHTCLTTHPSHQSDRATIPPRTTYALAAPAWQPTPVECPLFFSAQQVLAAPYL